MNQFLFQMADFLSRPPGFYFVIVAMIVSTALVPFGLTNVITYALSVAAIVITSVVLIQGYRDTAAIHAKLDEIIVSMRIQGYRDTAAIHAKLDEIIVSMRETRNEVVGLEHEQPERIAAAVERLEAEAAGQARAGISHLDR
ncbi:hypothetical protein BMJ30_12960 [Sinorhizobium medicae]|uniref:hypothetical protein n=1 Tax=Sinorhizobium medicae TaxID=110321 RepID=UPI000C7D6E82|nr:hypothetical protein [Sinorhizobium medicae]PLU18649.1 hypothetical protein BMJ30_12960 [Sinorhizobium medicae]